MTGLFSYIWQRSKREQIVILFLALLSLPFYYAELTIPKYIVTDAIQGNAFKSAEYAAFMPLHLDLPASLGGKNFTLYQGLPLDRMGYLFALSALFLLLVLVNGAFSFVINSRKRHLGEDVLRKLRYELFCELLSSTPESAQQIKASEAATIIKDEVEPIGDFVADAFLQPLLLGGQALTALLFIMLQSLTLGSIALGMVMVQGVVIPKLRRQRLRLGRERQLRSRGLATKIAEVVEGLDEVGIHGTGAFERHIVSKQLNELFQVRARMLSQKFMVVFMNTTLSQLTPFLFYTIGGFFALRGHLAIGQLVAVIAAYRDLPAPVKGIIDWDQQRLEMEVKHQQVAEHFAKLRRSVSRNIEVETDSAAMPVSIKALSVRSAVGNILLDRMSLELPAGCHAVVIDVGGDGAKMLGQVLGRRLTNFDGSVMLSHQDLADLSEQAAGRDLSYVGSDHVVFDATLRDNLLYGLRRRANDADGEEWIDYGRAGRLDGADVDRRMFQALQVVDLVGTVLRFGLAHKISSALKERLSNHVVATRSKLRDHLTSVGASELIEPFDPERYSAYATVSENIVFGVSLDGAAAGRALASMSYANAVLEAEGVATRLVEMGQRIAAATLEMFGAVSPGNATLEQFAFIPSDQFPVFAEILGRGTAKTLTADDRRILLELACSYVEPVHRLRLLTEDLKADLVRVRKQFRRTLPAALAGTIEFYDPRQFCTAAPLRDNLLFGRVTSSMASAAEQVDQALVGALADLDLEQTVFELGLQQPVGYGGRLLTPAQKTAVVIARSLIKEPRLLVLNDAFGALREADREGLLSRIRQAMAGRTLVVVARQADDRGDFDMRVEIQGTGIGRVSSREKGSGILEGSLGDDVGDEVRILGAVPIFAEVDVPRLKLLAFTSQRLRLNRGDALFRQNDPSDAAYVIISGSADVLVETPAGSRIVSTVGAEACLGEIGTITGDPRSATVLARDEMFVLRLSKDVFLSLLEEFPRMNLTVTRLIIKRLNENIEHARHEHETALPRSPTSPAMGA